MKKNFVLITGASSGLGREFGKLAAAKGYNLVLVSRNEEVLLRFSEQLISKYGIIVHIISKDLSILSSAWEIFDQVKNSLDLEIEILINNAGFGTVGPFWQSDLDMEVNQIFVNVLSVVTLTRYFLPQMMDRNRGIILNVSSTAAYQPGPYMSIYYASKAFVKNFTIALQSEVKKFKITVALFSPGPIKTGFQSRANINDSYTGNQILTMEAEKAAKIAFESALKGKKIIIPGLLNKIVIIVSRYLPEFLTQKILFYQNKKRIK